MVGEYGPARLAIQGAEPFAFSPNNWLVPCSLFNGHRNLSYPALSHPVNTFYSFEDT